MDKIRCQRNKHLFNKNRHKFIPLEISNIDFINNHSIIRNTPNYATTKIIKIQF
jgi:hypothetical protein